MIGKNPLWAAKQHGHSVATMLRVYTAWMDGHLSAFGNGFGTPKGVLRFNSLTRNEKKWRRGWDSKSS